MVDKNYSEVVLPGEIMKNDEATFAAVRPLISSKRASIVAQL